jgi:hypothetical protein
MRTGLSRRVIAFCAVAVIASFIGYAVGASTPVTRLYACVNPTNLTQRSAALATTVCKPGWVRVSWQVTEDSVATTTQATTTSIATTTLPATTTVPTTTTTAPTTTTTSPGGFMSYPLQACTLSINGGSNIVVSNKSFRGCRGTSAVVIQNATNVYLHDLDFDSNSGDIFLVHDTGQIRIENIRARNTGAGRTTNGSGQGEVIQLNNTFDNGTGGISNVSSYGGNTEDQISIFQSGGIDSAHPLVISDVHIESPLPPDALAWTSGSGTCINLADANTPGTGHIRLTNSAFLNCGQAGIELNVPTDVIVSGNVIYGAQRATSNVGLTNWAASPCSVCIGNAFNNNRVWWVSASGTAAPMFIGPNSTVSTSGNVLQDTTINPGALHVAL